MVKNKTLVLKMLCRGSGVRDCVAVTGVSKSTVLAFIKRLAAGLIIKPQKQHYLQVQVDEQWSYVGNKENKVWMLYAYAPQEDEILAFTMGKLSIKGGTQLVGKTKKPRD